MNRTDKQPFLRTNNNLFHVICGMAVAARWKLFTVLLVISMPVAFLLFRFASEGLQGWTIVIPSIALVALIIAGVKREGRRPSRPVPPRPPGEEEPSTSLHSHLALAERHAA